MKKRLFSILFMFLITLACTGILTAISRVSAERIETARQARMQRLVLSVLAKAPPKDATDQEVAGLYNASIRKTELDGRRIYISLGPDGKGVAGYAFDLSGPGFWGPIHGLMGVSPDLGKVLGVAFYDHQETPGLGGRIDEPWFKKQFAGKPLEKDKDGTYFRLVAPGTEERPTDVDAITGASETSTRLSRFLNLDLNDTLGWLAKNRQALAPGAADRQ